MTSVVPATAGDANDAAAAEPQEGVSSLSDAQRRWCIGAAVVVMGLASLGTALYQTSSAEVDPSASADAIAPLETSTSGSDAAPSGAGLPGGAYGLPGMGQSSADALPPLSLLPGGAAGALPSSGGIPSSAGVPDYVSPAPAQSPRVVQSPGLGAEAAPPLASLPPGGATAPSSAAGTAGGSPNAAGTPGAASASPYRQTGTPGVIQVAPGQAPPPGYRRVYPGPPRQQAAPGTQQRSRIAPDGESTPGTTSSPQRRTAPGTTSDGSSTSPSGSSTSPSGSSTAPSTSPSGSSTSPSTSPSGSSTAPSGRTAPRSQQPGLLGGLGG